MKAALLFAFVAVAVTNPQGQTLSSKATQLGQMSLITGHAVTEGWAYQWLEKLTDTVGGRVTGSPQSRVASELILQTLKDNGYGSAHFEEFPIASRWQRGPAVGRVIAPADAEIRIGPFGWTPGTDRRIEATVIDFGKPTMIGLPEPHSRFKDAAVIVEPYQLGANPTQLMRAVVARQLAQGGAVAMLIPSDKPGRMLYTSAFGFYPHGALPVLSIAMEDTAYMRRLLAKGPVKISLEVQNSFDASPSQERNVVADLEGTDPRSMVIVGAHFDSWDYAQGADDNGSGIAALLDAARILRASGVKPKATIRFVFFGGEEQGELGSRAYVKQHRDELPNVRMFFAMDSGAEAPVGFLVHSREDYLSTLRETLAPLVRLGASKVHAQASLDTDDVTYMLAGVPSMRLDVEEGTYDVRHHALTDTLDHVDAKALGIDTAVVACAALLLADAEDPPARFMPEPETRELIRKVGLEPALLTLFGEILPQ
jgi:carboxypeptidase Q